jgi:hypothetical protein
VLLALVFPPKSPPLGLEFVLLEPNKPPPVFVADPVDEPNPKGLFWVFVLAVFPPNENPVDALLAELPKADVELAVLEPNRPVPVLALLVSEPNIPPELVLLAEPPNRPVPVFVFELPKAPPLLPKAGLF